MEQEEFSIEAELKKRLSGVAPSRAAFAAVKHAVTNTAVHRSIEEGGVVPSPYQSLVSYIMNKTLLIGVPVAVIAVVALVLVLRPATPSTDNTPLAVAPAVEQPAAPAPVAPAPTPAAPAPAAPVAGVTKPVGKVDTSSVDSITAGFMADANADASSVTNDTSGQTTVNNALTTYNTVKTTSYDTAL
jgi:hypothetical protein